ncbi:5-oxoprolinase subunit PxpB [Clostridiaceae bacterium HSG29]|nr:5-oxoprolinase subunit PxpB [Clostridiaceae bacterium HSG29]
MEKLFKIKFAGDKAISVEFKNEISEETNNYVAALRNLIEDSKTIGIEECIPTYRALTICYNPIELTYEKLEEKINELMGDIESFSNTESKVYVIPVYYGGEFGPDIENVAKQNNLTKKEVVKIHTGVDYRIYMLGFTPGFPYLGGMDETISTPRLVKPRIKVNAGSVGIAGSQTGIYPIDSPGGWQIIGRTPVKLFDIDNEEPVLLNAGNYIRFKSIDYKTYERILKEVNSNTFNIEIKKTTKRGE